jgi:hypothetical protein
MHHEVVDLILAKFNGSVLFTWTGAAILGEPNATR